MSRWAEDMWDLFELTFDQLVSRSVQVLRGPTRPLEVPPPTVPSTVVEREPETVTMSQQVKTDSALSATTESSVETPAPAATTTPTATPPAATPSPIATDGPVDPLNHGDDVKLVAYSIVSIQRGKERFIAGGSETITIPMPEETFAMWIVNKNRSSIRPGERPYLRVESTLVRRWPKEPLHYEEKQLRILQGIQRAICETDSSPGPIYDREVLARALLGSLVTDGSRPTAADLAQGLGQTQDRIQQILDQLECDGWVLCTDGGYELADLDLG